MELRSCSSHLHFIQAIDGGQVKKVLNVTRKRPKLSFKKVSEIYGIMGFNSQAKPSTLKNEPENYLFGDNAVQVERICIPVTEAGRIEVKASHEVSSFASNDCENEESNDLGITLKQIKDKCKTKKRKLSKEIYSNRNATSIPGHVKEELKIVDHHINLLEPLSAWRSKLLKDKRVKKKSMKCKVDISSEGVVSSVKSEEIFTCQDRLLVAQSSTATLGIESESSGPEVTGFQQSHESNCYSGESCGNTRSKVPWTANECTSLRGVNEITIKRPCYARNDVSREFSELRPLQTRDSGWDILLDDSKHPHESSLDLPVSAIPNQGGVSHFGYTCALDDGMLISEEETRSNMVNETCNECHDMLPLQQESHLVTVEIENGEHFPHPPNENTPESENSLSSTDDNRFCVFSKECFDHLEQFDLHPVKIVVGAMVEEECELPQSSFHSSETIPLEFANSNAQFYYHVIPDNKTLAEDNVFANSNSQENKLQPLAEEENEVWLLEGSAKDEIQDLNVNSGEHPLRCSRASESASPYTGTRNIIYNNFGYCIPVRNSYTVSHQQISPETQKKPSSISEDAVEKGNLYDFTDDLSADGDENLSDFKLHRPERLLSARKTISPASQKKLCEALQSIELQETERFKCREKLNFGSHTEDQNRTAEGPYKIRRARFTYNRKQPVGKSNTYKRGHLSESVLKDPRVYRASHVNTRCTSLQSCSENAIAFSQRQMRDVECLARKLTKELISMKDAVEDILESESSATSMKHKIEKARIAVKNAKRAEESSKRWISMMSRDWSRFCKIMRLTENGSLPSPNVANKVKKIAFADETGGKLCDVKLFETDVVPSLDSK